MSDMPLLAATTTRKEPGMNLPVARIKRAWKAVVAAAGVVIIIGNDVVELLTDTGGEVNVQNVITWVVGVATVLGVYAKANVPAPSASVSADGNGPHLHS